MAPSDAPPGWDEDRTAFWLTVADRREAQFTPITAALFEAADLQSGERVLDVGCGAGHTIVRAHQLVGPDGRVTGNDVSVGMIGAARANAEELDLDWALGDAQTLDLGEARYDVIMSRFGVMFFDDNAAAFANLSRACASSGRMALAVWKSFPEVPLFAIPQRVVTDVLTAAGVDVAERPPGPGPTALGDPDVTQRMLHDAGWRDIDLYAPDVTIRLEGGASPTEAAELSVRGGPAARLLQNQPARVVDQVREALAAAYQERWDGQGIAVPGGCWIITARPAV